MERLTKRRLQLDTVEAYARICAYASCSCGRCSTCYCLCQSPYNPSASDGADARNKITDGLYGSDNLHQGSTQSMQV